MNLLKNPLIKIIGVIAILYMGLFSNKHDKNSLGNRLSKNQVKQNLSEVKEKSYYIFTNLKKAQDIAKSRIIVDNKYHPQATLIIKDIKIGEGIKAECNDSVIVNYKIYVDNQQLEKVVNYPLIIEEDRIDSIIAGNIIGLKAGGIRIIGIPSNYKTNDKNLNNYLSTHYNQVVNYEIELVEVKKSSAAIKQKCNFSKINE